MSPRVKIGSVSIADDPSQPTPAAAAGSPPPGGGPPSQIEMTPELRAAIELLNKTRLELIELIKQELDEN
jgi:hypothetical protein